MQPIFGVTDNMNTKFYDYRKDGITQGLLMQFMECREKTKLFLQGYSPKKISSPALTFGTIGHKILEGVYNAVQAKKFRSCPGMENLAPYFRAAEKAWYRDNPTASNESRRIVEASLGIAQATLPLYFKRWWAHDSNKIRFEKIESEFKIPFTLKDGRKTFIRGKQDGTFRNSRLWLFEHKFKSMINEDTLLDTLVLDFQVNFYLYALFQIHKQYPAGVLYNIIRKTSLERKQEESLKTYVARVEADIKKRTDFYFIRYEVVKTRLDINKFTPELHALITDFCDWYDGSGNHYKNPGSCQTKYGCCVYLPICSPGTFGLYTKRKQVFSELEA